MTIANAVNVVASEAANRFVAFSGERAAIVNEMVSLVVKSLLPDSVSCNESAFAECLVNSDPYSGDCINLFGRPVDIFNTPCAIDNGCTILDSTNREESRANQYKFQDLGMGL
jgi:hypothetical protein